VPKINVYVPAWLAEAVKESAVPVSAVCQQALEEAVRGGGAVRAGAHNGAGPSREIERALTNRARAVLREARPASTPAGLSAGLRLLGALEGEGGNLALVVLDSLGITRSHLRTAPADSAQCDTDRAGRRELDWLVERAATAAADMGDRHVGCEHLLLALVADPEDPAALFLERAGTNPASVRQATRTAAAAAAYARTRTPGSAVTDVMSGALEEIRARLGRLEQR